MDYKILEQNTPVIKIFEAEKNVNKEHCIYKTNIKSKTRKQTCFNQSRFERKEFIN